MTKRRQAQLGPKGQPYGGSAIIGLTDVGQNELTGAITEKVYGLGFYTGLTDVEENVYVGALTQSPSGSFGNTG